MLLKESALSTAGLTKKSIKSNTYVKIIAPPQYRHGGNKDFGVKPDKSTGTKPLLQ
jgi:hypothetical protein